MVRGLLLRVVGNQNDAGVVDPAESLEIEDAFAEQKATGAGGLAVNGLMIVAVAPLVVGADQNLAGGRKAIGFMEQLFETRERVPTGVWQTVDRIVERDDLAGDEFTVAIERLGNAARIVHRLDDDAAGLVRTITQPPLLPFNLKIHSCWMHQNRCEKNV
ncbi:MAG: hypothetical protein NTV56_00440 [Alphaproteobacteria bacterium]|nr:hypothetical protein [Alphaproteobacteria bacterium]